jgi:hypothetical protein
MAAPPQALAKVRTNHKTRVGANRRLVRDACEEVTPRLQGSSFYTDLKEYVELGKTQR